MQRLFIRLFVLFGLTILSSCGIDTNFDDMKLLVTISAKPEAPEGAEGSSSPKSVVATIEGMSWVNKETGETENLWEAGTEKILIVNRERIILEKDIKDQKGLTYSNFKLSLSTSLSVQGKYELKTLTLEPTNATTYDISYAEEVTLNEGKGRTYEISCNWYRTVTSNDNTLSDEITLPTFSISQSEN